MCSLARYDDDDDHQAKPVSWGKKQVPLRTVPYISTLFFIITCASIALATTANSMHRPNRRLINDFWVYRYKANELNPIYTEHEWLHEINAFVAFMSLSQKLLELST